ncbi:MAG: precorrin-6A/cobalt-precorrin-6A reductase, partial [Peptococcaceae bacterium]|nr:precorrin-6A/cobalt-precorrin-6A reductase [Peptococcaceae bacterium]
VAMQGPFSVKLNKAIFQAYRAGVVVTRDGGKAGGTYNKVKAALELKVPLVLIRSDKIAGPDCINDIGRLLELVGRNNMVRE